MSYRTNFSINWALIPWQKLLDIQVAFRNMLNLLSLPQPPPRLSIKNNSSTNHNKQNKPNLTHHNHRSNTPAANILVVTNAAGVSTAFAPSGIWQHLAKHTSFFALRISRVPSLVDIDCLFQPFYAVDVIWHKINQLFDIAIKNRCMAKKQW